MEFKNKLVVGLMSAMLAFTGLACAAEDTTDGGTDAGVEAPAEGGDVGGGATGGDDLGGGATEDMGGATP